MTLNRFVVIAIACSLLAPLARSADRPLVIVAYGQAAFSDQPLADERIERINDRWGTSFDEWNEPGLFVGVRVLKQVSSRFSLGGEAGYGRASLSRGERSFPPLVQPPTEHVVNLEEESDLGDFLFTARMSLCTSCARFEPFVQGAVGIAYARTETHFDANTTAPHLIFSYLELKDDGWFPLNRLDLGVTAPLGNDSRWIVEAGVGYLVGSVSKQVPAFGPQRFPGESGPRALTETSLTGATVWLGFGRRF